MGRRSFQIVCVALAVSGCRAEPPAPRAVDVRPATATPLPRVVEATNEARRVLVGKQIDLPAQRWRDVAAYCAEYTQRATKEIADQGGWAHLHPTPPSCASTAVPVPFRPTKPFEHVAAVATSSGLSSEVRLLVETSGGIGETGIEWAFVDEHASLAPPLPATLEGLRVEGDLLVAVLGRAQAVPTDGGADHVLFRSVIVCDPDLHCRAYFVDEEHPSNVLGSKRRRFGETRPWSALPWDRSPSFSVERERLLVAP